MYLDASGVDGSIALSFVAWAAPLLVSLAALEFAVMLVGRGLAWSRRIGR